MLKRLIHSGSMIVGVLITGIFAPQYFNLDVASGIICATAICCFSMPDTEEKRK